MRSREQSGSGEFDPTEVSVIIRRAVELAAERRPQPDERLSVDDLAAIADEVGLSRPAMVVALAESRAGLDHRGALADRLIGPSLVWCSGPLPLDELDEEEATDILRRWLEDDHGLDTRVEDGVRLVAGPRSGLLAAIGSGLRRLHGTGGLDKARSVRAATASVGATRSLCVVADVSNKRTEAILEGSTVAGGSLVVVGMAAALTGPLALVALPFGAAAGLATARVRHRRTVDKVTGHVEHATRAVARGERPATPVERLMRSGQAIVAAIPSRAGAR